MGIYIICIIVVQRIIILTLKYSMKDFLPVVYRTELDSTQYLVDLIVVSLLVSSYIE